VGARARLTDGLAALKARPRLLAGIQIVAVFALLAFLGFEFGDAVRDAWPRLRHANLKLVLLAHVLLAAYYLLFVLGWQRILRAYGIRLGYRAVLGAEMLSMLAKYIPGGVWTPAARVVAARRAGVDNTSVILATILLEAGLSAVAGVIVLAASLPFVSGVDAPVWPVVGFAVLATALLHPRVFAPLATRLSRRFGGGVIEPLPWGTAIGVLVFYAFTWVVGGAALTALLAAVGGHPGAEAIAYLGGASAVGAIVAVVTVIFPSGLGVREGAVGAFMLALAPDSAVVGAVVLNRLAITIVEALLLAGAAGLARGRPRSYPAPE
jgi:glycosyltransferase 2 family protein